MILGNFIFLLLNKIEESQFKLSVIWLNLHKTTEKKLESICLSRFGEKD